MSKRECIGGRKRGGNDGQFSKTMAPTKKTERLENDITSANELFVIVLSAPKRTLFPELDCELDHYHYCISIQRRHRRYSVCCSNVFRTWHVFIFIFSLYSPNARQMNFHRHKKIWWLKSLTFRLILTNVMKQCDVLRIFSTLSENLSWAILMPEIHLITSRIHRNRNYN